MSRSNSFCGVPPHHTVTIEVATDEREMRNARLMKKFTEHGGLLMGREAFENSMHGVPDEISRMLDIRSAQFLLCPPGRRVPLSSSLNREFSGSSGSQTSCQLHGRVRFKQRLWVLDENAGRRIDGEILSP